MLAMQDEDPKKLALRKEIEEAINKHSAENGSDTPDFILAGYLLDCLAAFDKHVARREDWYGRGPKGFAERRRRIGQDAERDERGSPVDGTRVPSRLYEGSHAGRWVVLEVDSTSGVGGTLRPGRLFFVKAQYPEGEAHTVDLAASPKGEKVGTVLAAHVARVSVEGG